MPSLFVAAVLVRRRAGLGYVLAAALIVLLIAATIVSGTVFQVAAGVEFAGRVAARRSTARRADEFRGSTPSTLEAVMDGPAG